MMVKVKICGITNATDARRAAAAGADALGFVFVRGTPRYIPPKRAKPIIMDLPPLVQAVGVFLDEGPSRVAEIADICGLDYVQLHGHEPPSACEKLRGRKVIKAFRIRTEADLRELDHYRVDAYLLDTYVPGVPGGSGETFDWELARTGAAVGKPIILAGGLGPENIVAAVTAARPLAVDVSSGVEDEPGKKNKALVDLFIRLAKSVEL